MSSSRPQSPAGSASERKSAERNPSLSYQPAAKSPLHMSSTFITTPESPSDKDAEDDDKTNSAGPSPCSPATYRDDHHEIRKLSLLNESSHKSAGERMPLLGTSRPGSINIGFGESGTRTPRSTDSREHDHGFFGGVRHFVSYRNGNSVRRSTTGRLAEEAGIKNTWKMYLSYYIPFLGWIPQYRWMHLRGDLVAALTMASFYLPMALSYASNLAHVPPINGLYSFVFNPLIYAILGSCPQMVVGPEAAGSLLVGSVIRSNVDNGHTGEEDDDMHARVAGIVTGLAGAVILIAGLARLGFLDSVLSRPFLRGFISAIGFVIVADQLIPEMGLAKLAEEAGVSHGSSVEKLGFLFRHAEEAHKLTCIVAGVSFLIIMVFREGKKYIQPRYPSVAYIPDRFLVVLLSAVITWQLGWNKYGLEVLGEVKSTGGHLLAFHWPFRAANMSRIQDAMGTSFLIALLGFFESSVAAKSLGGGGEQGKNSINGIQLSANRELVALGAANLVGSFFGALPAFGGYGRSKVNASTGGKTPMSSIFLSAITLICVSFLLPAFYYLPKAVLSSMITVVAWSLIEEAPHDIAFFIKIRGWAELSLMTIIFLATIFYSLTLGMAIGVGLSLLSVIKHSTQPRIQILGRIPGTSEYANAENANNSIENVEGCLIVKIPEPLTFANTGLLKARLRRLEIHGTSKAHPALPRIRSEEHNKTIIFDIGGVTELDGSGTQVLKEIVKSYRDRHVEVYFAKAPVPGSDLWELFERSGIVEMVGGRGHFVRHVDEALRLSEAEGIVDTYDNGPGDEGGG
ncbi:sulfate transporter family-domain-containing protein [Calycina marina]|uniref:Sulfate transporter family-domain-containing protein n=1 Tax=Calycina marina TaxID=1763456 RepID=A0A9P7Z8V4_9HELO|nr:sulfate transporter family-domain-containing protein [Calycina marina]